MTSPVDIRPGLGNPGIRQAREDLILVIRNAVLTAEAFADPNKDVRVCRWQDVPFLTVTFDPHTTLLIEPWSMGPSAGFVPRWRFSVSDVGDLLSPVGHHQLPTYDRGIISILAAVRVTIGMRVELV